jgi:hypothetical protein
MTDIHKILQEAFDKMSVPLPGSSVRVMTFMGFALIAEEIVALAYQKGKEEAIQHLEELVEKNFGS